MKNFRIGAALTAVILSAGSFAVIDTAHADDHKVTICHATSSETNPYVAITVAKNSIVKGHAHDAHHDPGDIIPPFDGYSGRNWTVENQAIHAAGCGDVDGPEEEPEVPEQPADEVTETSSTQLDCDDEVQIITTVITTTPYVFDAEAWEWVLGEPVSETTVEEIPVVGEVCEEPPTEEPPVNEPPVNNPGAPATMTEHRYDCDSHTAVHFIKRGGQWVEVGREVTPIEADCAPGATFAETAAEEGM